MARMFGTDGVRGVANTELTNQIAYRLGQAAVVFLGKTIVVGKDTRLSGDMLEAAMVAGIESAGGTALLTGVIPTPAVALLVRRLAAAGGAVISASHNPPEYNGIKLFDGKGFKLPDAMEIYITHAVESVRDQGITFEGMTIAIDTGHGASSETSPEALRRLGADVHVINDDYDGFDINVNCGSTHLEPVKDLVREAKADIGMEMSSKRSALLI